LVSRQAIFSRDEGAEYFDPLARALHVLQTHFRAVTQIVQDRFPRGALPDSTYGSRPPIAASLGILGIEKPETYIWI